MLHTGSMYKRLLCWYGWENPSLSSLEHQVMITVACCTTHCSHNHAMSCTVLVQVLQAADCQPQAQCAPAGRQGRVKKKDKTSRSKQQYQGSFRKGAAQDTVERLMGAYEVSQGRPLRCSRGGEVC